MIYDQWIARETQGTKKLIFIPIEMWNYNTVCKQYKCWSYVNLFHKYIR